MTITKHITMRRRSPLEVMSFKDFAFNILNRTITDTNFGFLKMYFLKACGMEKICTTTCEIKLRD